ncbi:MAG: T9SS type A sorting domain-containing protein [Bacteroidota bacterium]|nr:T9SS type A sorting domain-containing protein [Bacteroidota bacterium]
MKKMLVLLFVFSMLLPFQLLSQWNTVLATQDGSANGTGYQTPSVAAVNATSFVAVVLRVQIPTIVIPHDDVYTRDSVSANYLVAYSHATDTTGRMTVIPYASAGLFTTWTSGFDQVQLYRAYKAIGTPDSVIYVANNDPDHNILVFKLSPDSVISTDYRMVTGSDDIMGLAVDDNGYVYVLDIYGSTGKTDEVKVFHGIKGDANWGGSHTSSPIATIDLPAGVYRGLTVSPNGKQLFVSSVSANTVTRFVGSPTAGYSKDNNFSFALTAGDSIPGTSYYDSTKNTTAWDVGHPLGMGYLRTNNLLYVACARWLGYNIKTHTGTSGYLYSRIYTVNPNNGKIIDTLDVAKYYIAHAYPVDSTATTQEFDTVHIAGYSSTYDVAFDENKDMYSQSFYSWVAEKWHYTGTLPTVVVNAVRQESTIPGRFDLAQNYPNPFNPTTNIKFTLSRGDHVALTVENILGQTVATLIDENMSAGTHVVTLDASRLASGIYFYTLKTKDFTATKKMTLLK